MLAADACTQHGLTVHRLTGETRRRLHALVPRSGAVTDPIDTTATVTEHSFRRCLELAAADAGVHAVLALALPTAATGDLVAAIRTADVPVPLTAVVLDQPEAVRLLPRTTQPATTPQPGHSQPAHSQPAQPAPSRPTPTPKPPSRPSPTPSPTAPGGHAQQAIPANTPT